MYVCIYKGLMQKIEMCVQKRKNSSLQKIVELSFADHHLPKLKVLNLY